MKKCMDADNLHLRLKKINGQIGGIDRMIEEDVPCEDILIQINAAKSALNKVGQIILEGHMHHCVLEGVENGNAEETMDRLFKAIEQFSKIR
jgi:DNA-binding FrmR family transcriptional regulator